MDLQVVRGGEQAFRALVYPPPTAELVSYLRGNVNKVIEAGVRYGEEFANNIRSIYDKYQSDDVINASRLLLYQTGMHLNQNVIYPVHEDQLYDANLIMQRYIMSQLDMNKRYERQMCYGYAGTYVDPEPDVYGKDRRDYMRVMDGVLQTNDDNQEYFEFYSFNDPDEPLHTLDRIAILETWNNVSKALANRMDPSDPDRGEL